MKNTAPIKKADDEQHLVYAEVYVPNVPDTQGDFMDADGIREIAHNFMIHKRMDRVDHEHDNNLTGAYVVESFIARDDDTLFIPGSWVVGVFIPDDTLWDMVKSGDINGFSMEIKAYREAVEIKISPPASVIGKTDEADDHGHTFEAIFSDDGKLIGGRTSIAKDSNGVRHYHDIKRGTVTEDAGSKPHGHRFAFIQELVFDDEDADG